MKRYGEETKIDQRLMNDIASYMDDEIREFLHTRLAPCEPEEFLEEYLKHDPEFEELLNNEFGIEVDWIEQRIYKQIAEMLSAFIIP